MEQNIKEHATWHDFQKARLIETLKMAHKRPWVPALYFRFRAQKNSWGDEIRSVENLYLEKLSQAWLAFNKTPADPEKMRFANYLKLGVLWGVAEDFEIWFDKDREILSDKSLKKIEVISEQLTNIVSRTLV